MKKITLLLSLIAYMLWNNLGFAQKNNFEFPARLHQNFPQARHFESLINARRPAVTTTGLKALPAPFEDELETTFAFHCEEKGETFMIYFAFCSSEEVAHNLAENRHKVGAISSAEGRVAIVILGITSDEDKEKAIDMLAYFQKK